MSQQIIGISGKRGSGKDLLGTYLSAYGFVRCPFAAALKERVRMEFGFTKEHTDGKLKEIPTNLFVPYLRIDIKEDHWTPRQIMIEYGQFFRQFDPLWWVKKTFEQAEGLDKIVITDVRFKNEADYIKSKGGILVRLEREPSLNIYENELNDISETDLDNYPNFDLHLAKEYNVLPTDLEDFSHRIMDYVNK